MTKSLICSQGESSLNPLLVNPLMGNQSSFTEKNKSKREPNAYPGTAYPTKIRIDEIEKSQNDGARHPEEVGTILRKFEDYIVVSVNNGSIYIRKVWKNKKNIINSLKAGDKFYTKKNYLDNKNQRALFIKQTKIWNKNIRLKKIN